MPTKFTNRDATFEKMSFTLVFRFQTHNFRLLHQKMSIEFLYQFVQTTCHTTHHKIIAVLFQVQITKYFVNARIDVVQFKSKFVTSLSDEYSCQCFNAFLVPFTAALSLQYFELLIPEGTLT